MTDPHPSRDAAAFYAGRAAHHAAAESAARERSRRLSMARGAVFLAALAALVWGVWPGLDGGTPARVAAAAGALLFVALVARHERVEREVRRAATLGALAGESRARLARDWAALPLPPMPEADADHPYAHDLDVVGHGSLFHLLGGLVSPHGRAVLERWLLAPDADGVADLSPRRAAVAELAGDPLLREELAERARSLAAVRLERMRRFVAWAEGAPWLLGSARWRYALACVLTAAILATAVLHAIGAIDRPLWAWAIAAGWLLTALWRREVGERLAAADPGPRLLEGYPPLFELLHRRPFAAARLVELQDAARAGAGGEAAERSLARLARGIAFADARHMWLHVITHSLTLWDFHALARLERWQRDAGPKLRAWLEAVGELEALAALATPAHDHPHWGAAVVDETADRLAATALTHPLLPQDAAVANDVVVGPPGRLLLVTGSNMSGKSTLLRALGLNAVLARAGAPVAAASLVLPPLVPATSMRVADSLEQGVSHFMAELRRLRRVVDAAEAAVEGPPRVLWLVDEILQGTNTAERQVAARHVLARLLRTRAIGAATTHDLALGDAPELAPHVEAVHFQETVTEGGEGSGLTFDYRLRPGPATSVNALRLMRLVGL